MGVRCLRIATTLTALALLPAAAFAASAMASASTGSPFHAHVRGEPLRGTVGLDPPVVDALMRGRASNLFASFGWNGTVVQGSFMELSFSASSGAIRSLTTRQDNRTLTIAQSIDFIPSPAFGAPFVNGPVFAAVSPTMVFTAHDDPTGLAEFRTTGTPSAVVIRFDASVTNITDHSVSSGWPHSSLSFVVGPMEGRLILGSGSFNVSGGTVVANMAPTDLLVLKIVSGFETERTPRAAILSAFGAGRVAAEYAMVSESGGGWIQNSAGFRPSVMLSGLFVAEGRAQLAFRSTDAWHGLVVLAFDPETMPADDDHSFAVTVNGKPIASVQDEISTFYGPAPSGSEPFYTRLAMNATVVALYLPSYRNETVVVASTPIPEPGLDWAVEAAAAAGVLVVSVAAAVMFRRRDA